MFQQNVGYKQVFLEKTLYYTGLKTKHQSKHDEKRNQQLEAPVCLQGKANMAWWLATKLVVVRMDNRPTSTSLDFRSLVCPPVS